MWDWKCTDNSLCDVIPQISKNPVRQEQRGVDENPGWWGLTKVIKEQTWVCSYAIFHSSLVKIPLTSCLRHWGLGSGLSADALLTLEVPFSPLWYFYISKGQRIFLLKQSRPPSPSQSSNILIAVFPSFSNKMSAPVPTSKAQNFAMSTE